MLSASLMAPNSFPSGEAPKPMGDTRSPVTPRGLSSMFLRLRNGFYGSEEKNVSTNPNHQDHGRRSECTTKGIAPSCEESCGNGSNYSSDLVAEVQYPANLSSTAPWGDQRGDRPPHRCCRGQSTERNA